MKFRYETDKKIFRGNTHIHTTLSDGAVNIEVLARMYKSEGYDFLCFTDHWKCADDAVLQRLPLLGIPGVEIDAEDEHGVYYHTVGIGVNPSFKKQVGFEEAFSRLRAAGALIILAHPFWLGLHREDCLRHEFDGVEVYNHVCGFENGKSYGGYHWEAMLDQRPLTLGFASDDAHIRPRQPGWNGGWIGVWADDLSTPEIISSIKDGNFYSTTGPEIKSIKWYRERLLVETSPVEEIRLAGPRWASRQTFSPDGRKITSGEFEIDPEVRFRVEAVDDQGKIAWSNPVFVPEY